MEPITLDALMPTVAKVFAVPASRVGSLKKAIGRWQAELLARRDADLVGSFYGLLSLLGVGTWDPDEAKLARRLGVLARFSQLLADFESVTRRAREVDDSTAGRVVRGGLAGGAQYLEKLTNYISYYAQSAYDDFGGEVSQGLASALAAARGSGE